MRIVYAPRALPGIEEILEYIHARSPRGAHRVSLAIEYAIEMCALNPYASGKTDEPDVYRRPLGGKCRYTIFYRTLPHRQGIEAGRVVHSARVKNLRIIPGGAE